MSRKFPFILVLSCIFWAQGAQARDPKVEEMAPIQEISQYLYADTTHLYNTLAAVAAANPRMQYLLYPLQGLQEKSQDFYSKVMSNGRAPWRTTEAYRDLDRAFVNASNTFIAQQAYGVDPAAFEEVAFLLGALLQYYQEPSYQVVFPGYSYSSPGYGYAPYPVYPAYPRVVYPWIPSYYTFANVRFLNVSRYPWSRGVVIRSGH